MALAGNRTAGKHGRQKSPDLLRGFFLCSSHRGWLIGLLGLIFSGLLSGCTRPLVRTVSQPPAPSPPTIRVALGTAGINQLQFQGPYLLRLEEADYLLDERTGLFQVFLQNGHLILRSANRFYQLPLPVKLTFRPTEKKSRFFWNGHWYSGEFLLQTEDEHLLAVNALDVETYLLGVVPQEIPTGNEEYLPAIKAQAIAARSYALYRIAQPASPYFHVYADVRDQVYAGQEAVPELARLAVESTRGQVLQPRAFKNVKTISVAKGERLLTSETPVQYHSTCGGILEPDVGLIFTTPLREDREDSVYFCSASPMYRWVEKRTALQILNNLTAFLKLDTTLLERWRQEGFVVQIEVLERLPSGRVERLKIEVDSLVIEIVGQRIRLLLADSSGNPLPSRLFFLLPSRRKSDLFYIVGAGWGHGRGMCQWGALGMALAGRSFREILAFYFPNRKLNKIY